MLPCIISSFHTAEASRKNSSHKLVKKREKKMENRPLWEICLASSFPWIIFCRYGKIWPLSPLALKKKVRGNLPSLRLPSLVPSNSLLWNMNPPPILPGKSAPLLFFPPYLRICTLNSSLSPPFPPSRKIYPFPPYQKNRQFLPKEISKNHSLDQLMLQEVPPLQQEEAQSESRAAANSGKICIYGVLGVGETRGG